MRESDGAPDGPRNAIEGYAESLRRRRVGGRLAGLISVLIVCRRGRVGVGLGLLMEHAREVGADFDQIVQDAPIVLPVLYKLVGHLLVGGVLGLGRV